jgi:hypothetical protein
MADDHSSDPSPEDGDRDLADEAGLDDQHTSASASTLRGRLTQTFFRPANQGADPEKSTDPGRPPTDAEIRAKVMLIDPTERKIAYLGVALGVVMAMTFTIPYLVNPKSGASTVKATSKNCGVRSVYVVINHIAECRTLVESRTYWVITLAILLAFPLAIFVTVRIGRRSPLAYAALMTGLAFEVTLGLFGLPFLFAGGWLLIRAWKSQKYGSPTAKRGDPPLATIAPARSGRSSGSSANAKSTNATTGRSGKAKRGQPEEPAGRRPPEPNKRYTPKTPTKKKVPPAN